MSKRTREVLAGAVICIWLGAVLFAIALVQSNNPTNPPSHVITTPNTYAPPTH